jgi:hypothetical protein
VEEVREVRDAHAAKFNYDLKAICKDLKTKERDCDHPLVSFPPKILSKVTKS